MDNVKKQLRFFQVLVIVLVMVILGQFTFWITTSGGSTSSQFEVFPKMRPAQHSKVIAPAVSGAIDFFLGVVNSK